MPPTAKPSSSAAKTGNNPIQLWNLETLGSSPLHSRSVSERRRGAKRGLRYTLKGHPARVRTLAFTTDGQTLLSASQDGTLKSWNPQTGTPQTTLNQPGILRAMALSPDGQVATGRSDPSAGPVNAIAFSPDGQHLATAQGNTLTIIHTDGSKAELTEQNAKIRAIAFSPDSCHLASGDTQGHVRLWRL